MYNIFIKYVDGSSLRISKALYIKRRFFGIEVLINKKSEFYSYDKNMSLNDSHQSKHGRYMFIPWININSVAVGI